MVEALILIAVIVAIVWALPVSKLPKQALAEARGRSKQIGLAPINLSMLPAHFVVFDVETTGLSPERHEIIEFAAIKVHRDSDRHDTFSSLVYPRLRISSKITRLTGLDRKTLKAEGLPIDEVLNEFRKFIGDLPLVAFNASFDMAFLQSECRRAGLRQVPNEFDCALKVARKAWQLPSYKLSSICMAAGMTITSEHRALPDCRRAMLVYTAACSILGKSKLA